jgi:hypothetical protein
MNHRGAAVGRDWLKATMNEWLAFMMRSPEPHARDGGATEREKGDAVESVYKLLTDSFAQAGRFDRPSSALQEELKLMKDAACDVVHSVLSGSRIREKSLEMSVGEYFLKYAPSRLKEWAELGTVKREEIRSDDGSRKRQRLRLLEASDVRIERASARNDDTDPADDEVAEEGAVELSSREALSVAADLPDNADDGFEVNELDSRDAPSTALLQAAIEILSQTRVANKDPMFYLHLIEELLNTPAYKVVVATGKFPTSGLPYGQAVGRIGRDLFPAHSNPTKKILKDLLPLLNRIIERARANRSSAGGAQ